MITVCCPQCGAKSQVADELAGRKGQCYKCRHIFTISNAATAAAEDILEISLQDVVDAPAGPSPSHQPQPPEMPPSSEPPQPPQSPASSESSQPPPPPQAESAFPPVGPPAEPAAAASAVEPFAIAPAAPLPPAPPKLPLPPAARRPTPAGAGSRRWWTALLAAGSVAAIVVCTIVITSTVIEQRSVTPISHYQPPPPTPPPTFPPGLWPRSTRPSFPSPTPPSYPADTPQWGPTPPPYRPTVMPTPSFSTPSPRVTPTPTYPRPSRLSAIPHRKDRAPTSRPATLPATLPAPTRSPEGILCYADGRFVPNGLKCTRQVVRTLAPAEGGTPIAVSPDGKRLLYQAAGKIDGCHLGIAGDDAQGAAEIVGSKGRQWTILGSTVVFSADSKRWQAIIGSDPSANIRALVADGEIKETFDSFSHWAVSPDGRRFAFAAKRRDESIVIVDGQAEPGRALFQPLGNTQAFAFSPDSRRLAYAAKSDGKCTMIVDGKEVTVVEPRSAPCWSGDSKHWAVIVREGCVVDGQLKWRFPVDYSPHRGLTLSDDGQHFAVASESSTQGYRRVICDGVQGKMHNQVDACSLRFLPGGKLTYRASAASWDPFGTAGTDMFVQMVDGVEAQPLWLGPYSPDGKRRAHVFASRLGAYRLIVDGVEAISIDADPLISLSPDGRHVAACDRRRRLLVVDGIDLGAMSNDVIFSIKYRQDGRVEVIGRTRERQVEVAELKLCPTDLTAEDAARLAAGVAFTGVARIDERLMQLDQGKALTLHLEYQGGRQPGRMQVVHAMTLAVDATAARAAYTRIAPAHGGKLVEALLTDGFIEAARPSSGWPQLQADEPSVLVVVSGGRGRFYAENWGCDGKTLSALEKLRNCLDGTAAASFERWIAKVKSQAESQPRTGAPPEAVEAN